MLQLQVGEDSVCVPESWTDRGISAEALPDGFSVPILSPEALRELLVSAVTLLTHPRQ